MKRTPVALGVLGVGAVLLVLIWRLEPASVPLYDGLLLPPQPYRYLTPPAGVAHTSKKPTSALFRETYDIVGGQAGASFVGTGEAPPQARLIIDDRGLRVSRNEKSYTLSIRPIPVPSVKPDGPIDGNVYQLTATGSNGSPLPLTKPATVVLRGTGQRGKPVLELLVKGSWRHIATIATGNNDTYYGTVPSLGAVALVFAGTSSSSGAGWIPFAIVGAAVILILVVGLLLIRLSRRREPVAS